ncbi:hypothetical protein PHLGIDRAFT_133281 [Phlebiopsis gigantea 11061_1 CR5-6]|uniref:Uncharacterized protein n=1 Tax=Phlebiopsis gigantea (strain 11061_1 CR5-6) TaxID=745531 RepID=A0A0C3SFU6_PHLG1|nr:hypothetical protein PHLGIDRAFT_133281 [Phlebiopsis gigantea 11061_1 CR5-6]
MLFTTSKDPHSDIPATTFDVQENPPSSTISVNTRPTSQGPASRSADTSSTASSTSSVVVIAAAAGSGGVVLALMIFTLCYIRYKKTRRYHIDPYVTPDTTPSNTPTDDQDIFTKLPTPASSARPFLARLSFQTFAESTTTGVTLTDQIFPLPSEVEDVYSQLEALSVEVQKFRETEEVSEEHRLSRCVRAVTQDVHANIGQLRMEIQRLRRRSGTNTGTGVTTADVDLMHMLREVDMLRAELHDAVRQTDSESSIERLPSYHSRKTTHGYTADDAPPPLPSRWPLR